MNVVFKFVIYKFSMRESEENGVKFIHVLTLKVSSSAKEMKGAGGTAHYFVKFSTAITGGNYDWFIDILSGRF